MRGGGRKVVLNFVQFRCTNSPKKLIKEGIIHLLRTQTFRKNKNFLNPDTHTNKCVSRGKIFRKYCVSTKWMIPKIKQFKIILLINLGKKLIKKIIKVAFCLFQRRVFPFPCKYNHIIAYVLAYHAYHWLITFQNWKRKSTLNC